MPFLINDRVIHKNKKIKIKVDFCANNKMILHSICLSGFSWNRGYISITKWKSMLENVNQMKTDLYTLNETKQSQQLHFFPRIRPRIFTLYSHFIFCDLIFLSLSHCCCLIKMLFEFWLCGDSCSWNNLEKQEDISKLFLYLYVWEYICMNAIIMCTWPILENTMCKNCCFYVESWYCKK